MVEAAAIPETFLTVWTNLFERGGCKAGGDVVLIHVGSIAASRHNGHTACQGVGRPRVRDCRLSAEKARACEKLGAERGIDYKTEDFVEVIRAETKGYGVDVTLDMVAGPYVQRNLDIAAVEGRIVTISTLGGTRAEINMVPVMVKRLTLTGSTLRARTVAQKAAVAEGVRKNVYPLIESGKVRPVIFKTFPLGEAGEAHPADGILAPHRARIVLDYLGGPRSTLGRSHQLAGQPLTHFDN